MKAHLYFMKTITNLFVGDLGSSVGIVDKQVQRDEVSKFPTVFASSLKGALRDHVRNVNGPDSDCENYIFGKEGEPERKVKINDKEEVIPAKRSQKGNVNFLSAQLAFYPIRGTKRPYYLATCPFILNELHERLKACRVKNDLAKEIKALNNIFHDVELSWPRLENENYEGFFLDGIDVVKNLHTRMKELDKARILIMSDKEFRGQMRELPVVARNKLENGISGNLWYEEFVPRKSIFLLTMLTADYKDDDEDNETKTMMTAFEDAICNKLVQVGGNATVGDGLCEIHRFGGVSGE